MHPASKEVTYPFAQVATDAKFAELFYQGTVRHFVESSTEVYGYVVACLVFVEKLGYYYIALEQVCYSGALLGKLVLLLTNQIVISQVTRYLISNQPLQNLAGHRRQTDRTIGGGLVTGLVVTVAVKL